MKNKLLLGTIAIAVTGASVLLTLDKNESSSYIPRAEKKNAEARGWSGALEYISRIKGDFLTGEIDQKAVMEAREQVAAKRQMKAASTMSWKELGPDDQGGRTRKMLIDQNDVNHMFIGAASGGVYVTWDAGGHWTPVNDLEENLCVVSFAQSKDGDIYFGTGSSFDGPDGTGGSGFLGRGMWKSTDNGVSFTKLDGASPPANNNSSSSSIEWTEINAIACDPTNNNVLYAAMNRGLRRSTDAGVTWENVLYADCPSTQFELSSVGQDVDVDAAGHVIAGISGKVWRSTTGDVCSFEGVTGIPQMSRVDVAIAASDNNYVYAATVTGGILDGIYRSTDNGLNWELVQARMEGYFTPMGDNAQGWYDLALGVWPNDKNKVWLGGVQLWQWDGNLTRIAAEFDSEVQGQFNLVVHSDKHAFAFDPTPGSSIGYVLTDGGVSKTYDGGQNYLPSNAGYVTTQYYSVAMDANGMVMGGTQDNGTIEVNSLISSKASDEVSGGDGFDCDYSYLTDIRFASVYTGAIKRGVDGAQFGDICAQYCNAGSFYTVLRLWETPNEPLSQDTIVFNVDSVKQGVGTGNGAKKTFDGTLEPAQNVAKIYPGSVRFESGLSVVSDDGQGNLVGDGTGTIDYNSGAFSVSLNDAPGENLTVWCYYHTWYEAGSELILQSKSRNYPVPYIVPMNLYPGSQLKVQDPVQSLLAFGVSSGVALTRGGLDLDENPVWGEVTDGSVYTGTAHCMEFSKDGDHLFVGTWSGNVYRISNLRAWYDEDDNALVEIKKIGGFNQTVTGLGVDPNNPDHVIVTCGNYGNTDYVYRTQTATSATGSTGTFESIQSDLPAMPCYDVIIDVTDGERVVLGTEYGMYSCSNAFTPNPNNITWTDENDELANCPVFAVRQQTADWKYTGQHGVIYLGTHGRGMWSSSSLVKVEEVEGGLSDNAAVSALKVYPNPMNGVGSISFKAKESGTATVNVMNLEGRVVKSMNNVSLNEGNNVMEIEASDLPMGTYFVTLQSGNDVSVAKFVIVK